MLTQHELKLHRYKDSIRNLAAAFDLVCQYKKESSSTEFESLLENSELLKDDSIASLIDRLFSEEDTEYMTNYYLSFETKTQQLNELCELIEVTLDKISDISKKYEIEGYKSWQERKEQFERKKNKITLFAKMEEYVDTYSPTLVFDLSIITRYIESGYIKNEAELLEQMMNNVYLNDY